MKSTCGLACWSVFHVLFCFDDLTSHKIVNAIAQWLERSVQAKPRSSGVFRDRSWPQPATHSPLLVFSARAASAADRMRGRRSMFSPPRQKQTFGSITVTRREDDETVPECYKRLMSVQRKQMLLWFSSTTAAIYVRTICGKDLLFGLSFRIITHKQDS